VGGDKNVQLLLLLLLLPLYFLMRQLPIEEFVSFPERYIKDHPIYVKTLTVYTILPTSTNARQTS
jgi:hypothetical protein